MARELGYLENGTGKHQSNIVWDIASTSPTITTVEGGGTQQIKILIRGIKNVGNQGIRRYSASYQGGVHKM